MKGGLLLLVFLGGLIFINAQRLVNGVVIDELGNTLSNVLVQDLQTKKWTQTFKDGTFAIELSNETSTLVFSQIGREELEVLVTPENKALNIILYKQTLRLKEVFISAKKKKDFSEITLGREAIENIQSFSLDDVLKQLPGQITTSLDLNQFKNIVFRTAIDQNNVTKLSNAASDNRDYFGNKAFGTSIVVNGVPISNNENMQSFNPNASSAYSYSSGNSFGVDGSNIFSNANYGVDLREVQTNNIEEVQVIQGIPSAKYGDLTSGLVLVKTSVGQTPFHLSVSMQETTIEYALSKGVKLNDDNFLFLGMSYLDSKADTRTNLNNYERISGSISWKTNDKVKNFSNTLNLSFNLNLDKLNRNPDAIDDPIVKNEKKGFKLVDNFNWNFDKKWIDGLSIDASISYDKQLSRKEKWVNLGTTAISTSMESGIYPAILLPNQYTFVTNVEGIPISTFLNAEIFKSFNTKNNWGHTFSLGVSTKTSTNKGRGRFSDDDLIPNFYSLNTNSSSNTSGLGYRDYNFRNTKSEVQYSIYLQDKIQRFWDGNKILNIDAGIRLDNQLSYTTFQPRMNASYAFNKFFRLRGGYGISSKSPSLNQLYTGDRVYDRLITDIINVPGKGNFAWIETFILPGNNMNLKPNQSYKSEIGFDLNFPLGSLNMTGYYNILKDGFTTQYDPFLVEGKEILVHNDGVNEPTYSIVGKKNIYFFTNQLVNGLKSTDKGLEMFLNFKRIRSLNLDLSIKGSYVRSDNKSSVRTYEISNNILSNEYYGVYAPRESFDESMMLGADMSFHLPKVGLILSLRTEHIFIQSHDRNKSIYPIAYLDRNFNLHEIPKEEQTDPKYSDLFITHDNSADKLQRTLHNIHFRVSKDFLNGFKVSVYSTNVLGLKPIYRDKTGEKIIYPIAEFSIGGKIQYEF